MAQTPGLKKALAEVRKLGNQMNRERMGDYRVALSASNAISGNLGNSVGRIERGMLSEVLRSKRATNRLVGGARQTQRSVRASEVQTVNRYGTALQAGVSSAYEQARTTASAGTQMQRGAAAAGRAGSRAAQTVAALGRQGVQATQGAARYALAQALQQRAIVDSGTLAQLTGQLYQSALDYQNQWSMWKRQQDYLKKAAEKAEGGTRGQLRAVADALTEEGPQLGYQAWEMIDQHWTGEGLDTDLKTLASDWAAEEGYEEGSPQHLVMLATLRNLKNQGDPATADTSAAVSAAVASLYRGTPGWEKISGAMLDTLSAGTTLEFDRQRVLAEAQQERMDLYGVDEARKQVDDIWLRDEAIRRGVDYTTLKQSYTDRGYTVVNG